MYIRHVNTPAEEWKHFYFPYRICFIIIPDIFWRLGHTLDTLAPIQRESGQFCVRQKLMRLCNDLNQFYRNMETLIEVVEFGDLDRLDIKYKTPNTEDDVELCQIVSRAFMLDVRSQ
jgi:hypothetical protein